MCFETGSNGFCVGQNKNVLLLALFIFTQLDFFYEASCLEIGLFNTLVKMYINRFFIKMKTKY